MLYAKLGANHEVIPCSAEEFIAHQSNFESSRRVALDKIGEIEISTVFLAINHGWNGKDLWFETMIFEGPLDGYQERYETWDKALAGHKIAVEQIKSLDRP